MGSKTSSKFRNVTLHLSTLIMTADLLKKFKLFYSVAKTFIMFIFQINAVILNFLFKES